MGVQTGTVYMDVVYNTQKATADLVKSTTPAANTAAAAMGKPFEDKLASVGAKTAQVGKTMTTHLTLPLVGLGAVAIKEFTGYERSLASIEGLVGANQEQMTQYTEAVRRIGVEFGIGADAAADALYFITSSGLEGAAAIDALEQSAKAGAVGLGETQNIADLLTSALNAYGQANLSAAQATDILTVAVREGKGDPAELAGAMSRVLPIASQLGVSFDEVSAAFASMSLTGTDANEAATQIRGIMSALLKPSKQAEEALASVGLSSEFLRDKMGKDGLLPTLELLVDALGNDSAATATVFEDVRALTGVMNILGENTDKTRQIFDSTAASAGALDDAFSVTQDTAGFKLNQALSELKDSLIEFGDAAAPIVTAVAAGLAKLAGVFDILPGPIKSVVAGFASVVAIAGPMIYIGGKVASTIGSIVKAGERFANAGIDKAIGSIGQTSEKTNQNLETTKSRLAGVTSAMTAGTIVVAGFATAWQIWQSYMASAAASAASARGQIDQAFGKTTGVDEAQRKVDELRRQIDDMKKEAAKNQDGNLELSDITGIGTRAAIDQALPGFEAQADAQQKLIDQAKELAAATGTSADAMQVWLQGQSTAGTTFATTDDALKAYNDSLKENGLEQTDSASSTALANKAFDDQRKAVTSLQGVFLGVIDGQKSYQDALDDITDAQRSYEQSGRGVANATRSVQDAQRGVASATKSYEASLRSVESAQRDVTEAQKALDDALSPQEDEIALERARIRVEEAAKALKEKPGKDDDANDQKTKELDLRQAEIDLKRLEEEIAGRPGEREQAVADAQQKLTDAQDASQESLRGVGDAQRQVTDASAALRDAQVQQAEAADAVRDAQDKAALSALDLYSKQQDLTASTRDDAGAMGDLLAQLQFVQGAYPEVAAALQPYIDQLRTLQALRFAGASKVAAPTRDPDALLGNTAFSPQSNVGGATPSSFVAPNGAVGNTTIFDMNGMPPEEAFVYAQHKADSQLTTLAG